MNRRVAFALLFAAAAPTVTLHAQSQPSQPPPAGAEAPEAVAAPAPSDAPPPCTGDGFRQFDFWVGEWDVHVGGRDAPARNSIASLHGGCVVRESYVNAGYSGMSMNWYDAAGGSWHQLWADNQGLVLRLEGRWNGESMVLSNDTSRITWTPRDDGAVRQLWEQTEDGGATWKAVFDGTYVRRGDS